MKERFLEKVTFRLKTGGYLGKEGTRSINQAKEQHIPRPRGAEEAQDGWNGGLEGRGVDRVRSCWSM